jgi:hypothetical protein
MYKSGGSSLTMNMRYVYLVPCKSSMLTVFQARFRPSPAPSSSQSIKESRTSSIASQTKPELRGAARVATYRTDSTATSSSSTPVVRVNTGNGANLYRRPTLPRRIVVFLPNESSYRLLTINSKRSLLLLLAESHESAHIS